MRLRPTLGRLSVAWIVLAGLAAYGLFHVTFAVRDIEEELQTLNRQINDDQQAVHVLEAEWAYLNQPARLADLSSRYLGMVALTTARVGEVATLPLIVSPDAQSTAIVEPAAAVEPIEAWSEIRLRVRPGIIR